MTVIVTGNGGWQMLAPSEALNSPAHLGEVFRMLDLIDKVDREIEHGAQFEQEVADKARVASKAQEAYVIPLTIAENVRSLIRALQPQVARFQWMDVELRQQSRERLFLLAGELLAAQLLLAHVEGYEELHREVSILKMRLDRVVYSERPVGAGWRAI
ncbi:hypothetical protein [Sporosarcina highlanderae]|uniref:Uncharacterized protein n=1 Tax=Sporosarcina highlanderae TaxID=3035916 RepID=A0ABT8JTY9_9BACL|nr:hypothetical protein [Sporosarcina highlanderae]MDN4608631.1 hypothetical protein [Sporosarcina highlanderae]